MLVFYLLAIVLPLVAAQGDTLAVAGTATHVEKDHEKVATSHEKDTSVKESVSAGAISASGYPTTYPHIEHRNPSLHHSPTYILLVSGALHGAHNNRYVGGASEIDSLVSGVSEVEYVTGGVSGVEYNVAEVDYNARASSQRLMTLRRRLASIERQRAYLLQQLEHLMSMTTSRFSDASMGIHSEGEWMASVSNCRNNLIRLDTEMFHILELVRCPNPDVPECKLIHGGGIGYPTTEPRAAGIV